MAATDSFLRTFLAGKIAAGPDAMATLATTLEAYGAADEDCLKVLTRQRMLAALEVAGMTEAHLLQLERNMPFVFLNLAAAQHTHTGAPPGGKPRGGSMTSNVDRWGISKVAKDACDKIDFSTLPLPVSVYNIKDTLGDSLLKTHDLTNVVDNCVGMIAGYTPGPTAVQCKAVGAKLHALFPLRQQIGGRKADEYKERGEAPPMADLGQARWPARADAPAPLPPARPHLRIYGRIFHK